MHHSLRSEGWQYVCHTDIKGYYASINQDRLFNQLQKHVSDPGLMSLLWQFLH